MGEESSQKFSSDFLVAYIFCEVPYDIRCMSDEKG